MGSSEGQDHDEEMVGGGSEERHTYQNYPSTSSMMNHHQHHDSPYSNTFQFAPPSPPAPAPSQFAESSVLNVNGLLQESNMEAMTMPPFQMTEPPSAFDRPAAIPYNIPGYASWQKPFTASSGSPLRPYEQLAPELIAPAPGAAPGPALLESSVPGSSHFTFSNPQTGDYIADYDWLFDGANPLLSTKSTEAMYSSESNTTQANTDRNAQTEEEEDEDEGEDGRKDGEDRIGGEAGALHDLAFFAILQRVSSSLVSVGLLLTLSYF